MALLGFIVLFGFGLLLCASGFLYLIVSVGVTGKAGFGWLVYITIGVLAIYVAMDNSLISVTYKG